MDTDQLKARRAVLKAWLRSNDDAEDMHGVMDAAADIREIDAQLAVLRDQKPPAHVGPESLYRVGGDYNIPELAKPAVIAAGNARLAEWRAARQGRDVQMPDLADPCRLPERDDKPAAGRDHEIVNGHKLRYRPKHNDWACEHCVRSWRTPPTEACSNPGETAAAVTGAATGRLGQAIGHQHAYRMNHVDRTFVCACGHVVSMLDAADHAYTGPQS